MNEKRMTVAESCRQCSDRFTLYVRRDLFKCPIEHRGDDFEYEDDYQRAEKKAVEWKKANEKAKIHPNCPLERATSGLDIDKAVEALEGVKAWVIGHRHDLGTKDDVIVSADALLIVINKAIKEAQEGEK